MIIPKKCSLFGAWIYNIEIKCNKEKNLKNRIVNIDVSDNYRIIAISDIHGHYDILKGLMKKVDLRDEDFLVIIGDFINKGSNSYKTYKYIEELSKRKNTFILKKVTSDLGLKPSCRSAITTLTTTS